VRVTISGLTETEDQLREIAARLRDLRPVMEVAAADTTTLADDAFESEASPDGTPWAPLSPVTRAIRQRKRGNGPVRPLQDTTRLRRSITSTVGPKSFSFGTNVVYAGAQQLGNPSNRMFGRTPAPIPARPMRLPS
jgi:phage virion morphogenesis protein